MKIWKRIASLVLALTVVLTLGLTALADGEETTTSDYSITVTNTNTNVSISGKTYSAYKLFDVVYNEDRSSYAYTVAEEFTDFTYKFGEENYSGEALITYLGTLQNDSEALNTFAEAALKYVTDTDTKIEASGSVTIAADVQTGTINLREPGYYLVVGTASSEPGATEEITAACSLDTTNPTMTVNPKVDAPHVEKKIVEEETKLDETSASIGDVIEYEVTANIPDMTGYESYTFTFTDTMSKGLTFNDDVSIKLEFEDKTTKTLVENTDFTVATTNADEKTIITIDLKNFIQYKGKGGTVKVTYSATVNEDADLTETGNPNKVKLTFSNNPNNSAAGGSTATTPESTTVVYVTGLKLIKTDDSENPVKLAGAKFQISGESVNIVMINSVIYQQNANGEYARLKSDGTYETYTEANKALYDTDNDGAVLRFTKIETVTKETEKTNINTIGYTDANGVLTFEGLGAGTYTITELKAPDGYNLLKGSITIEIKWEAESESSDKMVLRAYEVQKDADGKETRTPLTKESETYLWAFTVVNKTGTELPSTGGIGTTMFYVIGSLLVVGAVILLITKKRLAREN